MTQSQIQRLKGQLARAENALVAQINAGMPADCVPDRVAIPMLNRLEAKQLEVEDAFATVRGYLNLLSERSPR